MSQRGETCYGRLGGAGGWRRDRPGVSALVAGGPFDANHVTQGTRDSAAAGDVIAGSARGWMTWPVKVPPHLPGGPEVNTMTWSRLPRPDTGQLVGEDRLTAGRGQRVALPLERLMIRCSPERSRRFPPERRRKSRSATDSRHANFGRTCATPSPAASRDRLVSARAVSQLRKCDGCRQTLSSFDRGLADVGDCCLELLDAREQAEPRLEVGERGNGSVGVCESFRPRLATGGFVDAVLDRVGLATAAARAQQRSTIPQP